jgi:Pyruvate/2-oxoacid:ferredoxin oxidoreductase delta subunit/uncharacterized protein YuzB (UPF0349 family)
MFKESTKALWRLNGGWKHPLLFLHAYFYLAHTDKYVAYIVPPTNFLSRLFPRTLGKKLMAHVQPVYHSKVLVTADARKVVTLDEDLSVDDEVGKKIITFKYARQILLKDPENIVVLDCGCRTHVGKCASEKYGINVCMVIGEPQASFILDHSKLNPKKLTATEAIERLEDFHKSGFVHTLWFKDALGYRSYAICNCCKCCCSAMLINNKLMPLVGYDRQMILSSGYLAKTDEKKCAACSTCVTICPFEARRIDPKTGKSRANYDLCHGCGVCVDACPNGAITLMAAPEKGIPMDLDAIKTMRA